MNLSIQGAAPNPNLLINGDFSVWQRGTNFLGNPTPAGYKADRWRFSGFNDVHYTKHTLSSLGNKAEGVCFFSSKSAETLYIDQPIEGGNTKLKGCELTVSLVVGSDSPQDTIIAAQIINNEGSKAYNTVPFTYTPHPDTVGWFIGTATMETPKVFDDTTSEHATLRLVVPPNGSGWVSEVKLEYGSVATPFVPDDFATNLAKCQRYFVGGYGYGTAVSSVTDLTAQGFAQNSNWIQFMTGHVGMRRAVDVKVSNNKGVANSITSWTGTDVPFDSAMLHQNGRMSLFKPSAFVTGEAYGFNYEIDAEL